MLFQHIKTEKDLRQLKRDILVVPVLWGRFWEVCRKNFRHDDKTALESRFGPGAIDPRFKMPTNAKMLAFYRALVATGEESPNPEAELVMQKIKTRSNSGVAVVSLLTKPFPCPGRCTYCPTEARMPKSYLSEEPAAARALANNFDPYDQVTNRLRALRMNGHPTDKVEMIVIGGTWSFYHPVYQEEFLAEVFRACNNFGLSEEMQTPKGVKSLAELQTDNETASARIIGLSIETRPDYITTVELERLRALGVTKVELGVQHLDDAVLKGVKRDMKIATVIKATERLRNAGFKIVYHMMPNLPGSTPVRDIQMFGELFSSEDFQPDMLKIYPCMVVPGSELFKEWQMGKFTPYADEELFRVLAEVKKRMPNYVRIIRVIRDIPATLIEAGSKVSNLRQWLLADMGKNNWRCKCIRCREVRGTTVDPEKFSLTRTDYRTTTGREFFLSFEQNFQGHPLESDALRDALGNLGNSALGASKLASFLRLRLPDNRGEEFANGPLAVLRGAALVRELHTYGRMAPIGEKGTQSQHLSFGKRLLAEAERIAREAGYSKLAVISGIGAREYYRKWGYRLEGTYMVKWL